MLLNNDKLAVLRYVKDGVLKRWESYVTVSGVVIDEKDDIKDLGVLCLMMQLYDYWVVLKYLRLFSLQRRRERYHIIYTWKILEDLIPNINGSVK